MKHCTTGLFAAALILGSHLAHADTIPYSHKGTIAMENALTATATGSVIGSFVGRGTAVDIDYVRLFDVTAGTYSDYGFENHSTAAGATMDFGQVTAGDVLVFELLDKSKNNITATSAKYSQDGVNHGYETWYAGGMLNGAAIPAGLFIGIEDRLKSQNSDFNYNDDTFVVSNVTATPTPEPDSLFLLATGICGAAGTVRRRFQS